MKKKLLSIIFIICVALFTVSCANNSDEGITTVADETEVTTQATGSDEITTYSDEQLSVIAGLSVTKDKLMEQYPTTYIQTASIVQNDGSAATDAVQLSYRGETKVLRLVYDSASGSKILSHFYNVACSKKEFDTLAIGQHLDDVQKIDHEGEYLFLYAGRNDVPKASTHYTTDGFVITITYDNNNLIEKIDTVPM